MNVIIIISKCFKNKPKSAENCFESALRAKQSEIYESFSPLCICIQLNWIESNII